MRYKDYDFQIEVVYEGETYKVWGTIVPPVPGRMYMANGDPGYPDEPGYVEIEKVFGEVDPKVFRKLPDLEEENLINNEKFQDKVFTEVSENYDL